MRDDFTAETKRRLADRAGHVCSFPGCRQSTSGPSAESPEAVTSLWARRPTSRRVGRPRRPAARSLAVERGAALDGGRALSGSYDGTLRLWDLESGACQAVFTLDYPALAVAVADHVVIAGDSAGNVHFLDVVFPENLNG